MNFISTFKKIIRECDYSNTYKMAWAKAIVELSSCAKDQDGEYVTIDMFDIAEKMFKYYWNQTIFFDLLQSAPNQPPVIVSEVKDMIDSYKYYKKDVSPIFYERAENSLTTKYNCEYQSKIKNIIRAIKENVLHRFLNLEKETFDLYTINRSEGSITFKRDDLLTIYENQQDLFDLINYRWSLMLENYNSCPRIAKKVRIMDEREIRRKSALTRFDKYLDVENREHICFICNQKIPDDELSRDHVIPWSYLYSDDLWNLVYVHKSCNSSKSNITPEQSVIDKLNQRNDKLSSLLHEAGKNDKNTQDLDLAIKKNYVDQFYIGCKG